MLTLAACVHAPSPAPAVSDFARFADTLLDALAAEGAIAGAAVLDERTGAVIYEHAARTRTIPASTLKLLATSAALAQLGPEWRFRTAVTLEGTQVGEVFFGELVVEASGDPSLGSWRWPETAPGAVVDAIAKALQDRGIRHLNGSVVVRGGEAAPDALLGPGWAWDDVAYDYSAAPLPFVFRENVLDVAVTRRATPACDQATKVAVSPAFPGFDASVRVEWAESDTGFGCVRDRGAVTLRCAWRAVPGSCPRRAELRATIDDPAALFRAALSEAFTRAGLAQVTLNPEPGAMVPALPPARTGLLVLESPPLAELVRVTNKESLNLYAERLALVVTRERQGAEGYEALRRTMAEELAARGLDGRALVAVDGSGLSRYNQASAWGLATLVQTSLQRRGAEAFVESLPVSGVDGTLVKRGTSAIAKGRVRAKSGSMTGQRTWAGLAERAGDPGRPRVVFALVLGNLADPSVKPGEVFDRFVDGLVTLGL